LWYSKIVKGGEIMSIFKKIIIREKKGQATIEVKEEISKSELEEFCGDDRETYEALRNTMFLDPRKITISIEEAAENAKKFEKEKDFVRARIWYEIAGGLAIWEGNVKEVKNFFSKCQQLSPKDTYLILKNPERAIAKAKEYYKKYLKEE
jgi:hypothetical protein